MPTVTKRCYALVALLVAADAGRAGTPLERVVNLLKDMKQQIDGDAKVEEKLYNKYACWCEEATKKKANAINDAEDSLKEAGTTILELRGEIATKTAKIKELKARIEENEKAQEEATKIRSEQNEEYLSVTAETKQAIKALQAAIAVLVEGATGSPKASLLQQKSGRAVVQTVVESLPRSAKVDAKQIALLSEFLDGSAKYTPQSMTVQGILKDLYATMAADVQSATTQEAARNREFEGFIATSIEEVNNDTARVKKTEKQKAEREVSLAEESQMYDELQAQMQADTDFFDTTKQACLDKNKQWTLRQSLRNEELAGITKAINMLSTDEARELFAASIKAGKETGMQDYDTGVSMAPALLQLEGANGEPAMMAYQVLKKQATGTKSLRLAALAVRVREAKVGHFDAVITQIDNMIKILKEEEAADIAKRDQCKQEMTQTNSTILQLQWDVKCNQAKIDKLQKKMDETMTEKQKTLDEIAELMQYMEDITSQREAENTEFNTTKWNDQQSINLIMEVREVFSSYYRNHSVSMGPMQGAVKGLALAQRQPVFQRSEFDAPNVQFSGKGSHKNEAKGIIQILSIVVEDLNDEIRNAMKEEEEAQLAYEHQMKVSTEANQTASDKVVLLEQVYSRTQSEKTTEETLMFQNNALLKDEQDYLKSITPDCEWVYKSFFERDEKRAAEMQGLVQAKDFLAGYKAAPGAELAQVKKFDDAALGNVGFLSMRA